MSEDQKLPGLGTILRDLGKAIDAQAKANIEAYERGELPEHRPIEYVKRRPNWCNECAKDVRLMPERIPQCAPGSGLCYEHQRKEREMRERLREEAKARAARGAAPHAPPSNYSNVPKAGAR